LGELSLGGGWCGFGRKESEIRKKDGEDEHKACGLVSIHGAEERQLRKGRLYAPTAEIVVRKELYTSSAAKIAA
jgi:hypothetical protein